MRALLNLLGLTGSQPESSRDTDTVHRIAAQLDKLEPEKARYLACFSYVLARVAHADYEISQAEIEEMEKRVRKLGKLGEPEAALVVQMAKTQSIALGATDNYVVTRQFREISTREQRLGLLRCLFAVAAADENVSQAEDAEIGLIANELGLTAPEVAGARAAYREFLGVLKNLPGQS